MSIRPYGFTAGVKLCSNGHCSVHSVLSAGEGTSWALEPASVYPGNERHFLIAGIKTRQYSFEYLNSTKQDYNINALFLGYNYSFAL